MTVADPMGTWIPTEATFDQDRFFKGWARWTGCRSTFQDMLLHWENGLRACTIKAGNLAHHKKCLTPARLVQLEALEKELQGARARQAEVNAEVNKIGHLIVRRPSATLYGTSEVGS